MKSQKEFSSNESVNLVHHLLRTALTNRKTLPTVLAEIGKNRDYVRDFMRSIDNKLAKGVISQQEYYQLKELHSEYSAKFPTFVGEKISKSNNAYKDKYSFRAQLGSKNEKSIDYDSLSEEEKEEAEYDAYADEKYDERSKGEILRESKQIFTNEHGVKIKKITGYKYQIKIKGEPDLKGELTREEMDMVYRLYSNMDGAGLTLRAVSRHFKHLTFRDFKRILRAFNITKSSIPVAPHVLEESTYDQVLDVIFRNKENNMFKKIEDERGRQVERLLYEAQKEIVKLQGQQKDIVGLIKQIDIENIKPFKIEKKKVKNEIALMVYLSDQHVGAKTLEDSIYKNDYDEKEFNRRLTITLEHIKAKYDLMGRFDKIVVCNLGDCLDGYNGLTTRGGHHMPQNMNNKEQFNVYFNGMTAFFDTLHKMNIANSIDFESVGNANHDGDFGYITNKALEYSFKYKFPDMKVKIYEKFIDHFKYGIHTFIMTHGKDKSDMKFGMPMFVNDKMENYFNEYMSVNGVNSKSVTVVKGDLHKSATSFGKRFRYKSVASLYGSSSWIHTNFGNTLPGVDYDIVFKNENKIIEGRINFF